MYDDRYDGLRLHIPYRVHSRRSQRRRIRPVPHNSTKMVHRVESCIALHNNLASVPRSIFLTRELLQVLVIVIRSQGHEAYVCIVTGTIVYSCSPTHSFFAEPHSSW